MLFIGKPSISMGHLYHSYVSHNQRVTSLVRLQGVAERQQGPGRGRGPGLAGLGEYPKLPLR